MDNKTPKVEEKPLSEMQFKEIAKKVQSYYGVVSSAPTMLLKELLSRIDASYGLLGLVDIGGEGIILAALDSIQTKIAIKIAAPREQQYAKNIIAYGIRKFKEVLAPIHFEERFIAGCELQNQLFQKTQKATGCALRVPQIRKVSKAPGLYVEMEYIEGVTILRHLQAKNSLGVSMVAFCKLLEAVNFFHGYGMVHRDLKSENIMVADSDRISIVDWTLSKIVHEKRDITMAGTRMGTKPYAAPEMVFDGDSVNANYLVDIYSLGVILYEFVNLSKAPRLLDSSMENKAEQEQYNSFLRDRMPPLLVPVFEKATALDPGDRYQTVEPFLQEVKIAMSKMGLQEDTKTISQKIKAVDLTKAETAISLMMCARCKNAEECCFNEFQACDKIIAAYKTLKNEGIL